MQSIEVKKAAYRIDRVAQNEMCRNEVLKKISELKEVKQAYKSLKKL
jgi:hypothetical protein